MNQDEFIAMKMLTRWKEIQREQPNILEKEPLTKPSRMIILE